MTRPAFALSLLLPLLFGHTAIAAASGAATQGRLEIFEQERAKAMAELRVLEAASRTKDSDEQKHRLRQDLAALEREAARVRATASAGVSPSPRKESPVGHSAVALRDPQGHPGAYRPWDVFRNFPHKDLP